MNKYKTNTPVRITETKQPGMVVGYTKDVGKYLIRLNSGIVVLKYENEVEPVL